MLRLFSIRWSGAGGYGEIFKLALPLILSTGSWSLQHFVDRMFLTWYSPEAIAASLPAGLLNWTLISLFIGVAAYVNTFVSQYYGAKQPQKIGPAVWQGIYVAGIAVLAAAVFYPLTGFFFSSFGHDPGVRVLEEEYFRILLVGTPFVVVANALSGFFSGLGRTWVVMWVNVVGTLVNLVLDYLLIFGNLGFPELGMAGAGWATVLAMVVTTSLFFVLFLQSKNNRLFSTRKGWRFNPELFRRLIRYGAPNGLQYVLELTAFTLFILLVGKLGMMELAASNIAFNINMLAFLPMHGLTIAVSILVGQRLGENRPRLAEQTTWAAFYLAFGFFALLGLSYFVVPQLFLAPFAWQANSENFSEISSLAAVLLRFVALYCLFDAGNMIFSGALKGAGDTRFVAVVSLGLSWTLMVVPSFLVVYVFQGHIYWLWTSVTAYIAGLCIAFWLRFKKGKWKKMRVIETDDPAAIEEHAA